MESESMAGISMCGHSVDGPPWCLNREGQDREGSEVSLKADVRQYQWIREHWKLWVAIPGDVACLASLLLVVVSHNLG